MLQWLFLALAYMFAAGFIVCLLTVIPITAYRLFMVLFEPDRQGDE